MPELDRFLGIRICVFSRDHLPPHFHAFYGEFEVLIDIQNHEVLAGGLPRKKLRDVVDYLLQNQSALLETFFQLNPQHAK